MPRLPVAAIALLLVVVPIQIGGAAGQSSTERFWLAGRYDPTHIIVYFQAVHFNGAFPLDSARPIPAPAADGFFNPVGVTAEGISRFQRDSNAERFAVGDRYDLLLEGGQVSSVFLTALVAFHSDEEVGNDSYIGAIGRVPDIDLSSLTTKHYVVRRHTPDAGRTSGPPGSARLLRPRVGPTVAAKAALLISDWLGHRPGALRPSVTGRSTISVQHVQPFALSTGDLRYFVTGRSASNKGCTTIRAWLAPAPALHVVAADETDDCVETVADGTRLLNIVTLGGRRTGMILSLRGGDGLALELVEYADGVDLPHMRRWHTISFGE